MVVQDVAIGFAKTVQEATEAIKLKKYTVSGKTEDEDAVLILKSKVMNLEQENASANSKII